MSKWSPTVFLTNSALTQLTENLCPGFLRVAKFFQPWQSAGPYLMCTIQIKSYLNPRRKSFDNSSASSEKYFTQPLTEVTSWGPGTMNNPKFITESLKLFETIASSAPMPCHPTSEVLTSDDWLWGRGSYSLITPFPSVNTAVGIIKRSEWATRWEGSSKGLCLDESRIVQSLRSF